MTFYTWRRPRRWDRQNPELMQERAKGVRFVFAKYCLQQLLLRPRPPVVQLVTLCQKGR